MPTTIYKRLNDREFIYSRNDLRKIAYWTHEKYIAENEGKDPDRVDQKEDDNVFSVFEYPDEWIEKIDGITDWYFNKKRKVGEMHLKREQRARSAKAARLKRTENGEKPQQQGNNQRQQRSNNTGGYNRNNGGYNRGNNQHNSGNNQQRKFVKRGPNNNNNNNGYNRNNNQQNGGNNYGNRPQQNNNRPKPNYQNNGQNQNRQFKPKDNFNSRGGNNNYQHNPNNQQFKPKFQNNNRFNNNYQNGQTGNSMQPERKTYNNFENDYSMSSQSFNPAMNRSRGSYYDNPNSNKFTQKVELYQNPNNEDNDSEQPKRRKRIAKALFVAAPQIDNGNETEE